MWEDRTGQQTAVVVILVLPLLAGGDKKSTTDIVPGSAFQARWRDPTTEKATRTGTAKRRRSVVVVDVDIGVESDIYSEVDDTELKKNRYDFDI